MTEAYHCMNRAMVDRRDSLGVSLVSLVVYNGQLPSPLSVSLSISLVFVVLMGSMELKASRAHAHSLIPSLSASLFSLLYPRPISCVL